MTHESSFATEYVSNVMNEGPCAIERRVQNKSKFAVFGVTGFFLLLNLTAAIKLKLGYFTITNTW